MARLLIAKPEVSFHTLFHAVLAQAGYVAIEAANSYEGRPAADVACLADGRLGRRAPAQAPLLIVDAEAQFHAFFCEVLAQAGYVVAEAVNRDAGLAVADAVGLVDGRMDLRYLVVYWQEPGLPKARGRPRLIRMLVMDEDEAMRALWCVVLEPEA